MLEIRNRKEKLEGIHVYTYAILPNLTYLLHCKVLVVSLKQGVLQGRASLALHVPNPQPGGPGAIHLVPAQQD